MVKVLKLVALIHLVLLTASSSLKVKTPIPLQNTKPNIVLLFVDDYGWADISYRNNLFTTPNLQQLKQESVEFTRAYIPTPTCSPSRYSLLTGREAVRGEMVRHIKIDKDNPGAKYSLWPSDPAQMPSINYMPLEDVTYAEKLKDLGYYNMFIGKWHLGHPGRYPEDQGFNESYGVTNAGNPKNYYYPFFRQDDDPKHYFKTNKEGDYLTDVLTNRAVDFIENYNKKQPFMLSFWYYSVHEPSIGKKELVAKYKAQGLDEKMANHMAMVETMDASVGRIRQALLKKNISDNTMFIFISDQGGAYGNKPLSGGKKGGNTLGEGGARVPFLVYYPQLIKAAKSIDVPVQSIDIFPTLMELASGTHYLDSNIQGVSLLPVLKGKELAKRNLYFFRSYEDQYSAVISGDWKLIKYHSGKFQLFNISKDISEQNNLIGTNLSIEQILKTDLAQWEAEAVPVY